MIRLISKKYFLPFVLLTISLPALAAESLPTAQDISDAAQKAKQTYDSFFSRTFRIRMQYEYSGRFLNQQDKDTLFNVAQQISADLEQIANTQIAMKKEIESYQKDDWETLFGQTGFWRKLSSDLLNTQAGKLEIDYCLARIAGSRETDQQFFKILVKSGMSSCAPIKASLKKIKDLGPSEPTELEEIARSLAKSDCSDNPEMLLTLAILQNKYAPDSLQNAISHHSQTGDFFGKILLADLSSGSDINSLNQITAELAAYAASTTNFPEHKELLMAIAEANKLKTPGTLCIAGSSLVKFDPVKAIEFLMESSDLQFRQNEPLLDIDAGGTAEYAARLAYDNFSQNIIDCNLALAAFNNYTRIASDKMTEEMRYLYGEILFDCGKTQEASEIFTKLYDVSKSIWHDKASLQLLKMKINAGQNDTLPQLRNLILNCTGQDEQKRSLRLEAMDLYCRTAIARDSNNFAVQVLNLLDTAEQTPGLQYDLFKAQALYQSGRLEESARYMSKAIIDDSGSIAPVAAHIVSTIFDKIELWQKDANDFNELLQNCHTLAVFANKSANTYQTALLLAEVLLLEGKTVDYSLPSNNENDPIWLCVTARLLMTQEKFEQSAKLWAGIAESKRNESTGRNQKSYGWWQAKFYELDCLAKSPQADKQNIAHAIDVLLGSYPQIPAPWAEKFDLLKKWCSAN